MTLEEAREYKRTIGAMYCKVCGEAITNTKVRIACILEGRAYCEPHFWEWKGSLLSMPVTTLDRR
uniref:Uncharacterized protein n=1 Tax=viral metagenome TaxID=1070528 RepID=A0A6H2A2Q7_9ZZZZ